MSQLTKTATSTRPLDLVLTTLRSLVQTASQIVEEHKMANRGQRAVNACHAAVEEIDNLRVLFTAPLNPSRLSTLTPGSAPDPETLFGNDSTRRFESDLNELIEEAVRKLRNTSDCRKFDLEILLRKRREELPPDSPVTATELELAFQVAAARDLSCVAQAFQSAANAACEMLGTVIARNCQEAASLRSSPAE